MILSECFELIQSLLDLSGMVHSVFQDELASAILHDILNGLRSVLLKEKQDYSEHINHSTFPPYILDLKTHRNTSGEVWYKELPDLQRATGIYIIQGSRCCSVCLYCILRNKTLGLNPFCWIMMLYVFQDTLMLLL